MLEVLADEIGDGVWRLALVVAEPATFQTPPFLSGSGPSLPSWNYGQSSSGRRCAQRRQPVCSHQSASKSWRARCSSTSQQVLAIFKGTHQWTDHTIGWWPNGVHPTLQGLHGLWSTSSSFGVLTCWRTFFDTNLCLGNLETILMFNHTVNMLGHAVLHVLFNLWNPAGYRHGWTSVDEASRNFVGWGYAWIWRIPVPVLLGEVPRPPTRPQSVSTVCWLPSGGANLHPWWQRPYSQKITHSMLLMGVCVGPTCWP